MSEPYVGEIRMFSGTFAPPGWLVCDGAILPVTAHKALYQVIGNRYGGDGNGTFALPNLMPTSADTAGVYYIIAVKGRKVRKRDRNSVQ